MKALAIASRTARIIFWIILGAVLLVLGVLLTLYSPVTQNHIRQTLVQKLNTIPGVEVQLDSLRLRFPLLLDAEGLKIVQNGDTPVAAERLSAKVKLLPLLKGEIAVSEVFLQKARYQMGNADSVMMILIKADTISISPASVKLSPLDIDIADGVIAHGLVALTSKVDTSATKEKPDSVAPMKIRVGKIQLIDFCYRMAMLPTIDSLGATVANGFVESGLIDLAAQTVAIKSFTGSGLNAAYIAPNAEQIASTPVPPPAPPTAPWTVTIDTIGFDNARGLYTTNGYKPLPGLDFAYIQADSMTLAVKNFYNQATTISLPIELSATERCGVRLHATGTYAMDSTKMNFQNFVVETATTLLKADGYLGVGDMLTDPALPLSLQARGHAGIPDLLLMFPAFKPYLSAFDPRSPLVVNIDVGGTAGNMRINALDLTINSTARLQASGRLADIFSAAGPSGNISLSGNIMNVNSIVHSLAADAGISVPPMRINGNVAMRSGAVKANVKATTLDGKIALDGSLNGKSEAYDLHLVTDKFPVQAFMKDLGLGRVTADISAKGSGFDVFSPKTILNASAAISSLEYNGYDYTGISLTASIKNGAARIQANADNPALIADLEAYGNLDGDTYTWHAKANAKHADLLALKFSPEPAELSLSISAQATATPKENKINASANLRELNFSQHDIDYALTDIRANFATSDSLTSLSILNRDLHADATLHAGLDSIMARMNDITLLIDKQMALKEVHVDSLQQALPAFNVYIGAGSNNFINDILEPNRMSLQRLDLLADNDSAIDIKAQVLGFASGATRLDTIGMRVSQNLDKMHMILNMDERPGTLDPWAHIRLDAILNSNQIALRASQKNIDNVSGYDIGAIAMFEDSTVTASIFPLNPTIGYKKWNVNLDNFISYTFPTKKIDANLKMTGEKSALALYTVAADSTSRANDVVLKLTDVHIQDWLSINPFAPPVTGDLNADLQVHWDGGDAINGSGLLSFSDFYYDRQKVGDFASNITVSTNTSGMIRAQADLSVNGQKAITIAGNLNDSTAVSPFNLDFNVIKFPLSIANPFLPADMARLTGTLNGNMDINGDARNPKINGQIYFEQAAVKVPMTNTSYAFSDVKIPVVDNVVSFNHFGISGTNENPLFIDGTVDMRSLMNPAVDLTAKASNIMVVNSSSAAKNALIFGKGYLDIDASVKGNMKFMSIDADVSVLSGTNVTYILDFATSTLQAPSQTDMVKFVNFADSTAIAMADTVQNEGMLMNIDANLNIQSGTTVVVDLNTGPRDKVQVQPQGSLSYTQAPLSDGRVMGRIQINSGFARYTIPVIGSEKEFTFDPSSYVAFNGDMLNPTLNIKAIDRVKSNVTQQGQNSRLVNFDVEVDVTGTLEAMDVKFDLSTNDDLTVANEIQSMTPEQRANQAMNLLLYNMYTGPGTKSDATNPLFSFLESQVNNWAAQNIKGVDLSFGIDQYNQTTNGSTSSTMNYSYQVSKTLFNDRFKIVVGGNYSTDDNADENLSENLINDISFEYYLNKQQTMLIKLFRHTGFESVLEGEITQTGVGFVYRRRLQHLSQMLPKFLRPKKYKKIER